MDMLNVTLYHGSEQQLEIIKPLGVNMGTRFNRPQWASFYWRSYAEAEAWAVFQLLRRVGKQRVYYHVGTGQFIVPGHEGQRQASKFLLGKRAYVYRIIAPRIRVGVGSSPDIHEFTLTGDQRPQETTTIVIDRQVLDRTMAVMSEVEIKEYFDDLEQGAYTNRRGFFLNLILDRDKDFKRHKYHKLIARGELTPGDDLRRVTLESIIHRPPSADW